MGYEKKNVIFTNNTYENFKEKITSKILLGDSKNKERNN